jgi:hypothetical protein
MREYQILAAKTHPEIVALVNEFLQFVPADEEKYKSNYMLVGGICVADGYFFQAVYHE